METHSNLMEHYINNAGNHIEEKDPRPEFVMMKPYLKGLGLEIGTGTNRLSPTVFGIDNYNHADADMVWDCAPEINGVLHYNPYPFKNDYLIYRGNGARFLFIENLVFAYGEPSELQKRGWR